MSNVKKGILAKTIAWAKHLRPFTKRKQWKRERKAGQSEARKQHEESRQP